MTASTIAIIDYGMGNLCSVAQAFAHVAPRQRVLISASPAELRTADRVVFPGQGAIGDCMRCLDQTGLRQAVIAAAAEKPFLGLCLGPQALLDYSEENDGTTCLGVLPGRVKKLRRPAGTRLKIPHMGWNQVRQTVPHALWEGIAQDSRFYFVHSYYLAPADSALTAGSTDYGGWFTAAVASGNIFAVQFHPEKSAAAGLRLLANFSQWSP